MSLPRRVPGSWASRRRRCSWSASPSATPGRRPGGHLHHLGGRGEVERAEELRALVVAVAPGAGSPELRLERDEILLVASDELDLDLVEPPGDPLPLEHRHRVLGHLRTPRADALAPGAQARDRRDRPAAEQRDEQGEHLLRRAGRRAGLLELDPGEALRQLQLPQPRAVLDAMAEGHAVPGEDELLGVVVGRDEGSRWQRMAAELRQHEPLCSRELQLPLDGLLHALSLSTMPSLATRLAFACREVDGGRPGPPSIDPISVRTSSCSQRPARDGSSPAPASAARP